MKPKTTKFKYVLDEIVEDEGKYFVEYIIQGKTKLLRKIETFNEKGKARVRLEYIVSRIADSLLK